MQIADFYDIPVIGAAEGKDDASTTCRVGAREGEIVGLGLNGFIGAEEDCCVGYRLGDLDGASVITGVGDMVGLNGFVGTDVIVGDRLGDLDGA
ncbi:hypothetical protein EON65_18705, partial [archaeon]